MDSLRPIRRLNNRTDAPIMLMETASGQQFAMKSMTTSFFAFRTRALFEQRLRAMIHITHPNLASIYAGRVRRASQCIIVSAYAQHGSLLDAVGSGPQRVWSLPLPPQEAARQIIEIAEGLSALHGRDIMHGGLKFANVLLSVGNDGILHPMLTDALLHRGIDGYTSIDVSTRPFGIADPFLYIAPEQYRQRPSLASDRYALGMIAFLLLTGETPYALDPTAYLQGNAAIPLRRASEINPTLPAAVDSVLNRMLRYQPRDRYRTVRDFVTELRDALQLRDTRRALNVTPGSMPASRLAATDAMQNSQAHEAFTTPQPLAILAQDTDFQTHPGLPALPPHYQWTAEVMASLPAEQPVPTPIVTQRTTGQSYRLMVIVLYVLLFAVTFFIVMHLLAH